MTWLPCYRSLIQPAFWNALTARSPETEAGMPFTLEPRSLVLRSSKACHGRHASPGIQRLLHECFPEPRLLSFPERCIPEWLGILQPPYRFHRVPASLEAAYVPSLRLVRRRRRRFIRLRSGRRRRRLGSGRSRLLLVLLVVLLLLRRPSLVVGVRRQRLDRLRCRRLRRRLGCAGRRRIRASVGLRIQRRRA